MPDNVVDQFGPARASGSVHSWSVASYHIRNGMLEHDTSARDELARRTAELARRPAMGEDITNGEYEAISRKPYLPFAFPSLPGELAKLRSGNEKAVMKFANTWGHLGYATFPNESGRIDHSASEPLEWIWAHAKTVKRVLDLIKRLSDLREAEENDIGEKHALTELSNYVDSIKEPGPPEGIEFDMKEFFDTAKNFFIHMAHGTDSNGYLHYPERPEWTPRAVASYVVRETINANLAPVAPALVEDEHGHLSWSLGFSTLITAIYWHLSNAAVEGKGYRICEHCQGWFAASSGKQKYCPRPPGKLGESNCALNARALRSKQRRLQEGKRDG